MLLSEGLERVLVVAPHADDEAMGCAGLMAKLAERDCDVHVLYMAVDGFHHYGLDHDTSYKERVAEIEAVTGLLGCSYEIAYGDEDLIEKLDTLPKRELVDLFERKINEHRPDLLLLPYGVDYDQDHVASFRAAFAAARPIAEAFGKWLVPHVMTYEMTKINWAAETRAYQEALYRAVKGSVVGSQAPVRGPAFSNVGDPVSNIGNLSAFMDQNDFHPYANGDQPEYRFLDVGNRSRLYEAVPVSPTEPMVASECGYHTALDQTPGTGQDPVSEAVAAKYIPRLVMEMYRRRIVCSIYELMDEPEKRGRLPQEHHFGLLRSDASPKPAYDSLRRLLNLLADKGGQPNLAPLEYDVYGNEAYIYSHLFRKTSGAYYLVFWQELPSWDPETRTPIDVPEKLINVRLPGAYDAKVHRTLDQDEPVQIYTGVEDMQVSVPDSVIVVELVRSGRR